MAKNLSVREHLLNQANTVERFLEKYGWLGGPWLMVVYGLAFDNRPAWVLGGIVAVYRTILHIKGKKK